jgi:voltage-gated potassium channel
MSKDMNQEKETIDQERFEVLHQVEELLEPIVMVLGFVWLALLIIELVWGASPFVATIVWLIWGIFLIDFLTRFILAPSKGRYLKQNWLTALSLLVPALRVFRLARLAQVLYATRTARGLALFRVLSSLNRGLRTLRAHIRRRGIGYVLALSALISLVGAAAMYFFEQGAPSGGFKNYWDALYWTGMMMTTMGSSYWPLTGEGRVLAFLLSLYAFTMFGYITATLATFFIGREADSDESELATVKSVQALREEIGALRAEIRDLKGKPTA